jgi:3-dehydroquinate synthase
MSVELGWMTSAEHARVSRLVAAAGLPVTPPPALTAARFMELMAVDKKVLDGRMRLVLLRGIGNAVVSAEFDPKALERTLDAA